MVVIMVVMMMRVSGMGLGISEVIDMRGLDDDVQGIEFKYQTYISASLSVPSLELAKHAKHGVRT